MALHSLGSNKPFFKVAELSTVWKRSLTVFLILSILVLSAELSEAARQFLNESQ